jgi:predicted flap endonuclease-1-like 5' DNA nuclease
VTDFPPAGVPAPARRALEGAGITSYEQLAGLTEKELSALHGMGPKAIRLLREALAAQGTSFKPA